MRKAGQAIDTNAENVDLVRKLKRAVGAGADTVVDGSRRRRAEYSTDASNYRVIPEVVVFPRDGDEIGAVLSVCRAEQVPLTVRGGGTSVAGNSIGPGIVVDTSRHMNRILDWDPAMRTARVQPGVVLDHLQSAVKSHGLQFGPDPSTHSRCTIGGMIGNDACGSHALAYGRTSENVLALDMLQADGRSWSTGSPPHALVTELSGIAGRHLSLLRTHFGTFGRQVSGYSLENLLPERGGPLGGSAPGVNLCRLLSGSEGTLAVITAADLRLVAVPKHVVLVVLGFGDMAAAADATPELLKHDLLAVEGLDRRLVEAVRARSGSAVELPAGNGWLFVEFEAETSAEAAATAATLAADAGTNHSLLLQDSSDIRALWRLREDGAGLAGRTSAGKPAWPGWEDAAVPPERLGDYLRAFESLMGEAELDGLTYGHFGDGCVHVRIDFPLDDPSGDRLMVQFLERAARLTASFGGSLSGEHGDGRARSALLPLMYPAEAVAAFEELKRAFDPDNLLNPGILVQPSPVTTALRVPALLATSSPLVRGGHGGSSEHIELLNFVQEIHRCVGVGKCRAAPAAESTTVMCPSFGATQDEKDSTRGRARVLQEMANGTHITQGWNSPEVLESLDLCLSCKGCSVDCPAGVDMAAYKAEVQYQRWKKRLRPISHYSLGWLPRWTRVALRLPRLINGVTQSAVLSSLVKKAAGVEHQRPVPKFTEESFRSWFNRRQPRASKTGSSDDVLLWVDTFTDAFTPEVGKAAVELLEDMGFTVHIPHRKVCCGLTWVSTGQLDGARKQLKRTMAALDGKDGSTSGMPILGLEPSCTALLRDEAARLLPDDARAAALRERVVTFAELVARERPGWNPPRLDRRAVVQPHCHQHAVMGFALDAALLERAGVEVNQLPGCCGLAGNFGAERGHYDISVAIAGQHLIPAIEAADSDDLLIADGFSCRTQAQDLLSRRPHHLVEILRGSPDVETDSRP